jgi:hypothetical protein
MQESAFLGTLGTSGTLNRPMNVILKELATEEPGLLKYNTPLSPLLIEGKRQNGCHSGLDPESSGCS